MAPKYIKDNFAIRDYNHAALQTCGTRAQKNHNYLLSLAIFPFQYGLDLGTKVPGERVRRYKTFKLYKMATYLNNAHQLPRPGYWACIISLAREAQHLLVSES